ncbi:PREDICTED: chloride channel protein 2-like [Rhagoletis zephyria]|uniref:chloride channel protein 2-like n=1 Tax=Rhagoletis zephyria TaxID=28612 RepID=UPI0008112B71|nr:PREDICTED: chloride channel protein 2-like [Rhagoletis zephyria]
MDNIVHQLMHFRHFLTHDLTDIFALNYAFWVLYMLVLVLISATITRYFSPQAAGSGVSEMKVILRGVTLKEYLSLKTLLTKIVGETFTLASGIYLGKEGPFVHISAMVANQFMKIFYHLTDPQQYESRFLEIMAVACGVGVAVSFASPVGGVLYSIEIVSVFFSVRSYWHGFTAATIGALLWRLLPVWFGQQEVVAPLFKTAFRADYPYETLELLSFALLGLLCGLAAYAYISLNRWFVLFNRRKNRVNAFLQQYPLLYPIIVTVGVGLVTFPSALGQYYTSCLTHEEAIRELYSNYTWFPLQNAVDNQEQRAVVDNWHTAHTTVFENTLLFSVMNIILIAVCTTLPIPGGIIVPSFKIGAGFGRFYGEGMAYLFPHGLMARFNRTEYPILAGTYALVGSAAFAGANTGAMSSALGRAIDNLNQHDKEPEAPEMNGQKEPLDAFSDDDEEDDNEDGNKSGSDVEKGKVAVKKTVSIELPKK